MNKILFNMLRRLSMDKKYTIAMIAVIVEVIAIGAFFAFSNFSHPESSAETLHSAIFHILKALQKLICLIFQMNLQPVGMQIKKSIHLVNP